jgi:hypothetical protein
MYPEGLKHIREVEYGPRHHLDPITVSFMPKIYDTIGYHLKDQPRMAFDTLRKRNDLFINALMGAGKTAAILSMLALHSEAHCTGHSTTESYNARSRPSGGPKPLYSALFGPYSRI